MTGTRTFTERQLEDRDSLVRGSGSRSAWMDLMCRFSRKQREHLANLIAHDWTVSAVELQTAFNSTGVADERVVAEKSTQAVFANGPLKRPVLDEEDLSATVAELHAEVVRLKSAAKLNEDSAASDAQALREALDSFEVEGPGGLAKLLEAVGLYAAPRSGATGP